MRSILLTAILLLITNVNAQTQFRGLSWGDTPDKLKSLIPDKELESFSEGDMEMFGIEDNVGGLEVMILYTFMGNEFKLGTYLFSGDHFSDNKYYDDFKSISKLLNKKYEMVREDNWIRTTWKNNPDYIGYALSMGDVEIIESYENDSTRIVHRISSNEQGGILHMLLYGDLEYVNSNRDSMLDDF